MATTQTSDDLISQLLGNGGSVSNLAQLGLLLRDAMKNNGAASNARQVAEDASANLTERSNVTNSAADQALALIAALQQQMGASPESDDADLTNRSDQIFSNLVGTVDRSNAITSSQGYAKALRNGLADSSQAADSANNISRNFSDVYAKLRETANAQAFDEAQKRKAATTQAYQAATQVAVPFQGASLNNAKEIQQKAAVTAQQAAAQKGQSNSDLIGSTIVKGLLGMADKSVEKAGGFSGLLESLKNGLFGSNDGSEIAGDSGAGDYNATQGGFADASPRGSGFNPLPAAEAAVWKPTEYAAHTPDFSGALTGQADWGQSNWDFNGGGGDADLGFADLGNSGLVADAAADMEWDFNDSWNWGDDSSASNTWSWSL